jgi:hypothetical protein
MWFGSCLAANVASGREIPAFFSPENVGAQQSGKLCPRACNGTKGMLGALLHCPQLSLH